MKFYNLGHKTFETDFSLNHCISRFKTSNVHRQHSPLQRFQRRKDKKEKERRRFCYITCHGHASSGHKLLFSDNNYWTILFISGEGDFRSENFQGKVHPKVFNPQCTLLSEIWTNLNAYFQLSH